ncbi:DC-STAMP domain-containing protein 2-like [Lytechinus pictus]|uniref:DC-STAMP domain-containing protein 2-like n=1 Tax=Lytechinus pictus TaxID=7653 RepID=UPI0030BA2832
MMKVAGTAAKKTGKKAAKKTGKKVAKTQAKKAGKKAVKKQAKKQVKKQTKKQAKKHAKKHAKKQVKKQVKKKAKKKVKQKAKKKVKDKAKKKVKDKAKKKVKDKAKKKVKDKAKKKVKDKAKKKVKKKAKKKVKDKTKKSVKKKVKKKIKEKAKEQVEDMIEDLKDDALDEIQNAAEDFIRFQLETRLGGQHQGERDSSSDWTDYSDGEDPDGQGKKRKGTNSKNQRRRKSVKIFEQDIPDTGRFKEEGPGLIKGILKIVFFIIWKILTCFCWCLCKCLKRVFRDRTPAEAKCCWKWCCVPGSYPNTLGKNIGGFLSGCILAFIFYFIFIFIIGYDWKRALTTTSILGFIFCFGLAFSSRVRCIVMLMLPQFFTGKGRVILMAYGYILLLGGPLANLTYNLDAASRAQACGRALAMNQSSTIFQIVTSPLSGIVDGVKDMIETVKTLVKKAHDAFMALVDAVKAIGDAIQAFFDWLDGMVDRCNEKMGRPRDICYDKFEEGEKKCRAKGLSFVCNIVDLTSKICEVAAMGQLLCFFPMLLHLVVTKATTAFDVAVDKLEEQFYVEFEFTHEFSLNRNFSKSADDIKEAIMEEIGGRTSTIRTVLYWVNYFLSFTVAFLFIKAMKYRASYLAKDKFDNVYITDQFVRLEEKRMARKKFTLFPLTDRETRYYVRPFSLRLAKSERKKMVRGLVMWFYQAGYALMLVSADVSAFSFLTVIREKVKMSVKQGLPGTVHLIVQGDGLLSDVYRVLVKALDPASHANITIDTTKCLPAANPPDLFSYYQIGGIFLVCLLLVLTESYGRRLRRVAAAYYYPEREKLRVVWLYNHIMRKRGGLVEALKMKFQRQGPDKTQEDIGFRSKLASSSRICRLFLGLCGYDRKFCIECGLPGKPDDQTNFRDCGTPDCDAIYCLECIAEINNMCTLCMGPVEYIDYSDLSEEKDSSDDDYAYRRKHVSNTDYQEDSQYLLGDQYEHDDGFGVPDYGDYTIHIDDDGDEFIADGDNDDEYEDIDYDGVYEDFNVEYYDHDYV